MKKADSKKKIITSLLVALVIVGIVFLLLSLKKSTVEYTTLIEDTNNRCSESGLSSAVGVNLVEFQVPKDQADQYIKESRQSGRCIYRNEDIRNE